LPAALTAQQHTHISGLIQDPSRAAVPGAAVSVVNEDTGFRRVTRSQSNGGYLVASLQPGLYKITVRKEGFRTLIRLGVKLDAAQPARLDFTLPLGSVHEVITVTGSLPLLNCEDASVGAVISRERIENLPLNGRGLLSLLEFAPGAVVTPATRGEAGQFTVSGQRPNANYFTVDGVSANTGVSGGGLPAQSTGGSLPGLTALGSLHGLISLEALNEFRVQTSTATPEFGKLPGAQVLLSSRSGSNEFHGSLFSYVRNGRLDANDWFSNRNGATETPLRMNDFGATLGGPLKRNRTFFFLSYEGMRLREPFAWRAPVPSSEARAAAPDWARPVLDLFPLPNGRPLGPNLAEWTGQNDRRSRFDVASLRIDHALTSRLTIFARFNGTLSSNEFTSTQVNDLDIRAGSLTFGANLRLSPTAVLDLKLNRSHASGRSHWRTTNHLADSPCFLAPVTQFLFRTDGPCDSLFRFAIAGVGQAVVGREGDQRQSQWHVLPTAVVVLGGHQIRLGVDHRRYAPERRDHSGSLSIIAENLDDLLIRSNLWVGTSPARTISSALSEFSVFSQDTWRIRPNLTATFGLRWEYSRAPELTVPDDASNPLTAYGFDGQTRIWRRSYANFAPRAGIAYRPIKQGRLVLRAGWGLFYNSALSIATDLVNGGPLSVTQYLSGKNAPFSTQLSYGFAPDLRLPAVHQWNFAVEREISGRDAVSAAYVGSSGRRLLRREFGGLEGSQTTWLALSTNHGESSYHGLQMQYRKAMTRGFQALASYSWSHSIDNSSSDSVLYRIGPGLSARQDRGSSDFDVRHALTLSLTYETAPRPGGSLGARLWGGWGVDVILRARSGFPITLLNSEYSMGLGFANAYRPDLVPGQPAWLADRSAPGGRRLNRKAFQSTTDSVQGNLGRNAIRGFGMHQIDIALRREFKLAEQKSVQLRIEAFNLLNHPNFADPARFLSTPLFGESPSMLNLMLGTGSPGSGLTPSLQTGGARSVQLALRFRF
jgi:hypothetical protein